MNNKSENYGKSRGFYDTLDALNINRQLSPWYTPNPAFNTGMVYGMDNTPMNRVGATMDLFGQSTLNLMERLRPFLDQPQPIPTRTEPTSPAQRMESATRAQDGGQFYNNTVLDNLSDEQKQRRLDLLNAANKVASSQGNSDNLRQLLIMTAAMENSLGVDSNAYGRDYTYGPMSIDSIAYNDLMGRRAGSNDYTTSQKKYFNWMDTFGYKPENFKDNLSKGDPLAGMVAARMVYGRASDPLPPANDPDALYDYYVNYYNKGGQDKYGSDAEHKTRFMNFYKEIFGGLKNGGSIPKYVNGTSNLGVDVFQTPVGNTYMPGARPDEILGSGYTTNPQPLTDFNAVMSQMYSDPSITQTNQRAEQEGRGVMNTIGMAGAAGSFAFDTTKDFLAGLGVGRRSQYAMQRAAERMREATIDQGFEKGRKDMFNQGYMQTTGLMAQDGGQIPMTTIYGDNRRVWLEDLPPLNEYGYMTDPSRYPDSNPAFDYAYGQERPRPVYTRDKKKYEEYLSWRKKHADSFRSEDEKKREKYKSWLDSGDISQSDYDRLITPLNNTNYDGLQSWREEGSLFPEVILLGNEEKTTLPVVTGGSPETDDLSRFTEQPVPTITPPSGGYYHVPSQQYSGMLDVFEKDVPGGLSGTRSQFLMRVPASQGPKSPTTGKPIYQQNGGQVPINYTGPVIQPQASPTIKQGTADSLAEDLVELIDPTGITSWDDVYRAWTDSRFDYNDIVEPLGALPFLGKVFKPMKMGKGLLRGTTFIQHPVSKVSSSIGLGDSLSDDIPDHMRQDGGQIPVSLDGLNAFPMQPVAVPSNNITMQGIDYPVTAYPDNGRPLIMQPGMDYLFPESTMVVEKPLDKDDNVIELEKGLYFNKATNEFIQK